MAAPGSARSALLAGARARDGVRQRGLPICLTTISVRPADWMLVSRVFVADGWHAGKIQEPLARPGMIG